MEVFTVLTGTVAAIRIANINTDVIIHTQRSTRLPREQLGQWALETLRLRSDGSEEPDFILNRPPFRHAPILLTGPNFGCGSSRETAVWALVGRGIRCILSESFGDIFFSNCFQNGVLPIRLPAPIIERIDRCTAMGEPLTVDLVALRLRLPGGETIAFDVNSRHREALIHALDDIDLTLRQEAQIGDWQARDRARRPWVWEHCAGR